MKTHVRMTLILVLCFLGGRLQADDQVITLGKGEQWTGLQKIEGLSLRTGRGGYAELLLSDSEYPVTAATDLLLHFNSLPLRGETSRYTIVKSRVEVNSRYARYGGGSGVFTGQGGVTLTPGENSLFSPGTVLNDFSIEFWLYPAALNDGETVFSWQGFKFNNKNLVSQSLECRVEDRCLVWTFDNFFSPVNGEPFRFEVKGLERLIPRRWHHHLLRYDSDQGVLEYLVDGVPVGTRYASINGRESSPFCLPVIGEAERSTLVIGGRLTGFLDEFRICREFVKTPLLHRFAEAQGRATSRVFDLGYSGTLVKKVNALFDKPSDTEINFYIRTSDTFNTFDRLKEDWVPFLPGTSLPVSMRGRYLQLMVEFYPDGTQAETPRLFEISVVYAPDLAPGSPADLKVVAGDGRVTLTWKRVPEDDVRGYYVFYGEAPLNYQGEGAREGISPINVGNVTSFEVTGLKNGRLYFFAVAAYDSSTPPHLSEFHQEKSARPSEALK
jgi:hypothetical protein